MIDYQKNIKVQQLEQELTNISEKIMELKIPKGFLGFILYTISELFANIKEHSKTKKAFLGIKISQKNFLVKITDQGIGLKKSYFLKKIYPKDDRAAIEFALSGLSTKDPKERGFGLYSIRKLSGELEGKMIIKSGLSQAVIEKNKISFETPTQKTQGTDIKLKGSVKKIDFYKIIK